MKIREIRTPDELQDLAGPWDHLLGHRGEEALNSSFHWVSTWWKHYSEDRELFILAAEESNQIVAIAPLFVASSKKKRVLRFKRAYFLGDGISDYGSFLTPSEPIRAYEAFLNHLGHSSAWHELRLQNIPQTESNSFELLGQTAHRLGYAVNSEAREPNHCYYIDARGDFPQYVKTTGRFVKTDVARQLRRIEEVGGFELKFTNDLSVSELLQAAADIHTKRQNELGRESLFERPNERAFVEEICALYKQRGWLDYIVLIMHGRIAAYELGFLYGGVRYGWIMGFDPEYHKLSLGKVLTYHWIEDAFRRKEIVEFNFMRGDSEYKRKFTDHYRSNHHFIVRHPNSLYVRGIGLAERVLKSRG